MSLGATLLRIWQSIKSIFAKIPQIAKDALATGVKVVDWLKGQDASNPEILELLQKAFPGIPDIHTKLAEISTGLLLVQNETDPTKIVQGLINVVKTIDPAFKTDILNSLAGQVAIAASDGHLTRDEISYLMKWYYDHVYKSVEELPMPNSDEEAGG